MIRQLAIIHDDWLHLKWLDDSPAETWLGLPDLRRCRAASEAYIAMLDKSEIRRGPFRYISPENSSCWITADVELVPFAESIGLFVAPIDMPLFRQAVADRLNDRGFDAHIAYA